MENMEIVVIVAAVVLALILVGFYLAFVRPSFNLVGSFKQGKYSYADSVRLEWDDVKDIKYFYILRKKAGEKRFKEISLSSECSYEDTDFKPGTWYEYKIQGRKWVFVGFGWWHAPVKISKRFGIFTPGR